MDRTMRAIGLLGILLMNSCYVFSKDAMVIKDAKSLTNSDLVGKWSSEIMETEWGSMKIELLFSDHEVEATAYLFGEDSQDTAHTKGPYELKEGFLVAEIIFKRKPAQILLDGPVMTLKAKNEQMVLKRKK